MEWPGHCEKRARRRSGGDGCYGEAECRFTLGQEVVLVARGGGGDDGAAMAEMNRPVELHRRRPAVAVMRRAQSSALARQSEREEERASECSEQQGRGTYVHALA